MPGSAIGSITERFRTSFEGNPVIAFETTIVHLPETTSTNDEARRMAEAGAAEGTVIRADHQTSGRGRYGREWFASPGQNVLLSIILRPELPADRLGLVTLAGAVAVANTIQDLTGLHASIKWPNDVLVHDRKVSGMLLESTQYAGEGAAQGFVIVGIGVNVNQQDFPPDLAARSTSLMLEIGRRVSCDEFVNGLMTHFARHYLSVYEDDGSMLRAAFVKRMTGLGEPITLYIHGGRPPVVGRMAGLSSDGGLELELNDGRRHTFHAGEVTSDAGQNTGRTS